jgi:signal transduction histidine kinase
LLLLVVGAGAWTLAGRALRPVEAIRREVEAIGAEDLHRRVPEPPTGDEIERLARTMNTMLTRLDDSAERQRQFVADASHELRSPLAGIRAQLEVSLAYPDRGDRHAIDEEMLSDAVRLQRLVDDLLLLSRLEASNSGQPARQPVDLDAIVFREIRRLQARSAIRTDARHVSGAQVVGDPDELTSVVRNLLENAARHAESEITVALHEDDHDAVLSITDDGPGIPSESFDQIFERFARLDEGRQRDAGGSGLGLAIVHSIVSAHGGRIEVRNVPGARFTVTLPLTPVRPATN